nr:putative ribonuclease h protein [Quercus suber]
MLRECPYSVSFWNRLGPPSCLYNSFGLPLLDWLHDNCSSILPSRHHGIPWSTLFIFGLWSLWTNRNCATYQAKPPNQQLLKECVAKALEYHFLTASSKVPSARPRLNAKWDKPPPGWYKLNTDASIINGHAGAGGLLSDSSGTWVQGFSKPLGIATVLVAELWALREGLRMARQLNID